MSDPKGGVMLISHLYEGAISDKHIVVKRSGFLEVLKQKILIGELNENDPKGQCNVYITFV